MKSNELTDKVILEYAKSLQEKDSDELRIDVSDLRT
tara:strand:- start:2272 stop:2379 length:108 start_codon:yes stop_codon:yes gene_type:complete